MPIIIDCMKKKTLDNAFGKRLVMFRRAKGLTQTELGSKIGISKRMVAYYEGQTERPPAHLLIPIAKTLKISVDELLGLKRSDLSSADHAALWRRLKKAEQLTPKDKKTLLDLLSALLAKSKAV